MEAAQVAVLFVGGLILVEVVKLAVARVFRRTVETEYMTTLDCRLCREECLRGRTTVSTAMQENIRELGKSIDLLRGILLVLAVKAGVDDDTLQRLANRANP